MYFHRYDPLSTCAITFLYFHTALSYSKKYEECTLNYNSGVISYKEFEHIKSACWRNLNNTLILINDQLIFECSTAPIPVAPDRVASLSYHVRYVRDTRVAFATQKRHTRAATRYEWKYRSDNVARLHSVPRVRVPFVSPLALRPVSSARSAFASIYSPSSPGALLSILLLSRSSSKRVRRTETNSTCTLDTAAPRRKAPCLGVHRLYKARRRIRVHRRGVCRADKFTFDPTVIAPAMWHLPVTARARDHRSRCLHICMCIIDSPGSF